MPNTPLSLSRVLMLCRSASRAESRGSIVLASLMVVSFGMLLFVGMVSTTLTERLRTDHTIRAAQAFELARSGIEYAVWHVNYVGDPENMGSSWRCAGSPAVCTRDMPTSGGGTFSVTIDKDPATCGNAPGNWCLRSAGNAQSLIRNVAVEIQAPGGVAQPGRFEHLFYTRDSRVYITGGAVDGGGNPIGTQASAYDALGDPVPFKIRSDFDPNLRNELWDTFLAEGQRKEAAAIVIDDDVFFGGLAELHLRLLNTDEATVKEPGPTWELPGYVLYPVDGAKPELDRLTDHGFTGCTAPDGAGPCSDPGSSDPLDYPDETSGKPPGEEVEVGNPSPVDGMPIDSYGSNPDVDLVLRDENWDIRLCPGGTGTVTEYAPTEIFMDSEKLVVGCHGTGAGSDCDTNCPGADPNAEIKIYTGDEDGYIMNYAGAVAVAGGGQIEIRNPTKIYYNPIIGTGLDIGGGGIVNTTNDGSPDATKLLFYRNDCEAANCAGSGIKSASAFSTTTAFYGAIFDAGATVIFKNGGTAVDFHGALNVEQVSTYDPDTFTSSVVHFHWPQVLETVDGGGVAGGNCTPGIAGNPCTPQPGTWSFYH